MSGCGSKQRTDVLPVQTFTQIYTATIFLGESSNGDNARFIAARDSMLRTRGVDTGAYQRSIAWYAAHPEQMQKVMSESLRLLEEMKTTDGNR